MKDNSKAVVKTVKMKDDSSNLIAQALATGASAEVMEKLFALRAKIKAEQAREAFMQALADFQSEAKTIDKTKKVMNKDGRTVRYQYAPLEAIIAQIRGSLAKNGLSYTWDVKNDSGAITAVCSITHRLGYSQSSEFKIPIDTEGYMTAPQKVASALTFAKRYSLCNALGISTGEEDTDANDVGKEATAKSEKAKILFLLRGLGKNPKTKEEVIDAVKSLVEMVPSEENYVEIVEKLEILLKEKQEFDHENN